MLRTWVRDDGSRYDPSTLPAFWRRVADQPSWQQAQSRFGPLDNVVPPEIWAENWQVIHSWLGAVAKLWRPAAGDSALYQLIDRTKVRQNDAARGLYGALMAMISQSQLVVGADFTWRPEIRAVSLRAFLVADCATAIGEAISYRRCDHCREWFTPLRSDARYCSNACKQAAYAARQTGGC
jgi:hypothetical protein